MHLSTGGPNNDQTFHNDVHDDLIYTMVCYAVRPLKGRPAYPDVVLAVGLDHTDRFFFGIVFQRNHPLFLDSDLSF